MKARLTRDYQPPPEWGQLPYRAGLVVDGELARRALADGAATQAEPILEHKITLPPQTKRRGRPPKNRD
jgi:hypothetical protein